VNKEGFIQKELRYAREISLEKPEGSIYLIPLRLDDCDVPRGLRFIQWVNYFGEDREENYENLLESLKIRYTQILSNQENRTLVKVENQYSKKDLQPLMNVVSDYYNRLGAIAEHPEKIFGVPTGFVDLDSIIGGLQPSTFSVVASFPGHGKTSLLLSIARNAALVHKKYIAFFLTFGMTNEQALQRLLAQQTGIDSQRLRTGQIEEREWPLLTNAIEALSESQIFL